MLIFLFYYCFFLAAPIFSFHGRLDWKEHEPDWVGINFETNANSKQVVDELFSEKKLNLKQKQVQSTQSAEGWSDCMLIMVTELIGVQFGL